MTHSINKLIKEIHNEEQLTSIIVTHEMKTAQMFLIEFYF